jgi:hypothetical protein
MAYIAVLATLFSAFSLSVYIYIYIYIGLCIYIYSFISIWFQPWRSLLQFSKFVFTRGGPVRWCSVNREDFTHCHRTKHERWESCRERDSNARSQCSNGLLPCSLWHWRVHTTTRFYFLLHWSHMYPVTFCRSLMFQTYFTNSVL